MMVAGMAAAQNPPPDSLAPLEQAVLKATTDWQVLARDLEGRVARMLPCDPRTRAAIDDVSKASQNRLAALAQYYNAAQALAENRAEGAKRLLATEEGRSVDLAADRVHADEALAALQAAITDLAASARVQPALAAAQGALQQTAEMLKQRVQLAQDQAARRTAVLDSLRALASAYQTRETAMKEASAAFELERSKWNAYYTVRSQRAQTECALTGGPPPAGPKPAAAPKNLQGKQK
jgi:hypothetical protein